MRLNYNQFLAVVYGDVFDWPLSQSELRDWRISGEGGADKYVEHGGGYYFLPGRGKLVRQRLVKEKISTEKRIIGEVVANLFVKIPTVEAIFLTGSVAVGSAIESSDIDLMIVTQPNCLWITRAIVVVLLKALQNYGNGHDRICPNIFLDINHLEIKEKNLYTAHEVLQAKCLFDRGEVEKKWLNKNKWTKKFLPNAYKFRIKNLKIENSLRIVNWKLKILGILELLAFVCQYLYQLPKQTSERLGWGYAFFHPENLSEKVMVSFRQRLLKYTD